MITRATVRLFGVVAVGLLVLGGPFACSTSEGFRCGRGMDLDPSQIQVCAGPNEVCICATNSCAVQEAKLPTSIPDAQPSDSGVWPISACKTGYRYVGKPFAREDVADSCVPFEHMDQSKGDFTHVIPPGRIEQCPLAGYVYPILPPQPPKGRKDSGVDASSVDAAPSPGQPDGAVDGAPPPTRDGGNTDSGSTDSGSQDASPTPILDAAREGGEQ